MVAPESCKPVFNHGKASAYQVGLCAWCCSMFVQDCVPRYSSCRDRKAVGSSPAGAEDGCGTRAGWELSWPPPPHPPCPWSLKLHLVNGSPFEAVTSFLFSLCNDCKSISTPVLMEFSLGKSRKQTHPPEPVPHPSPSPVSPWQMNWEPEAPFAAVHDAFHFD